jgi:hypothetical protein
MLDTTETGVADQIQTIERSVSAVLDSAKSLLEGKAEGDQDIAAYVREMQRADAALARAVTLAEEAGLASEVEKLARKRNGIDRSVARQITLVAANTGREREKTIATLNAIFKLGRAPEVMPDGVFRGQLLTTTLFAPLDAYGRFVIRFYLPWKGKRFEAESATGRNIFTRSAPFVGRLFWPLYAGWRHYRPGYFTGFKFDTYSGQGVNDPEVSTFKLDYDNPSNPRFLVRSVLDELVQITGNYYLGKAMLYGPGGHYRLAAFFVLRK